MSRHGIAALTAAILFLLGLCSCTVPEYAVDYGGNKECFLNAEDTYRAGEKVELRTYLATDTDYSLRVDGKAAEQSLDEEGFLVFTFVMPDHDVTVEYNMHNSMINTDPEPVDRLDTEKELLFDYYSAPVAVVGESEYHETTLNRGSDGGYYLNTYSGSCDEGTTESHDAYYADAELLEKLTAVVERYGMAGWNGQTGIGSDGAIRVVKFRGEDGELIRVSTEHMPENGDTVFDEIISVLSAALQNAQPVEFPE